jgi:ubiquinone/menaquinone biosynthesis C-methylase UbiE
MKKLSLIVLLTTASYTLCMKQEAMQIKPSTEWDDEAYSQANKFQEDVALQMLRQFYSPDYLHEKKVLDVGCGTGNITVKIAKFAKKIRGIDASNNMIERAKKTYGHQKNLSFEHCHAEDFTTKKPYDDVTIFNCLHWIKDKNAALKSISMALKSNGSLLGNVCTSPSPNIDRIVATQLALELVKDGLLNMEQLASLANVGETDPTKEEFEALLKENNFEIQYCKEQSFDLVLTDEKEIEKLYRPIIMAHEVTKSISEEHHENLFTRFITMLIEKMTKDERGYSTPMVTTIFYALKLAEK